MRHAAASEPAAAMILQFATDEATTTLRHGTPLLTQRTLSICFGSLQPSINFACFMLLVPQVFQSNPRDAMSVWSNTQVTFTLHDVSLAHAILGA